MRLRTAYMLGPPSVIHKHDLISFSPQPCRVEPGIVSLLQVDVMEMKAFQVALVVKNAPAQAGDVRDSGLIPGSGRSPGGGHGNPLHYSYLEDPMDRRAWRATVCGVAKSQKLLSNAHPC